MKNDKLLILDVTLARYGGVVDNSSKVEGNVYKSIQIVDFTVEKTITGIIDKENSKVIDIETGAVFQILKRDKDNRIIDKLVSRQLYPISFVNKNWIDSGLLYQLCIKAKAKQVYQHYLENMNNNEVNKVKIKSKEI